VLVIDNFQRRILDRRGVSDAVQVRGVEEYRGAATIPGLEGFRKNISNIGFSNGVASVRSVTAGESSTSVL
jgi:hypothetical protein